MWHDVIIIGAGASGIGAASKLYANDFTNFIILEARSRIGGGQIIEEGAQYIHGEVNNSVFNLVKDLDVYRRSSSGGLFDNIEILSADSKVFDQTIVKELFAVRDEIMDLEEMKKHNIVISEYYESHYRKALEKFKLSEEEIQILIDTMFKLECVHNAATMDEIGTQGLAEYIDCGGDRSIEWKTGYSQLFDILMGENKTAIEERILQGKEVTRIEWGEGVRISCSDGSTYEGQRVLVTVPLGVLKSWPTNFFNPELPTEKSQAIQALGFGTVDKIFLLFKQKWWSGKQIFFGMSSEMKRKFKETSQTGDWPTGVSLFLPVRSAPNVILAWISCNEAKAMEEKTDEEVRDQLLALLRNLNPNTTIPEPTGMFRSRWFADKYAKGSYSFVSVSSEKANIRPSNLAKPVHNGKGEPVILFGGEATHDSYFSTVHGALQTGWREAERIMKLSRPTVV